MTNNFCQARHLLLLLFPLGYVITRSDQKVAQDQRVQARPQERADGVFRRATTGSPVALNEVLRKSGTQVSRENAQIRP